jgi:hypothetical protein
MKKLPSRPSRTGASLRSRCLSATSCLLVSLRQQLSCALDCSVGANNLCFACTTQVDRSIAPLVIFAERESCSLISNEFILLILHILN